MAPSEMSIEFLPAGIVVCPFCEDEVGTVARVLGRDDSGMPTVEQFRIGTCLCGQTLELRLQPHGLRSSI
jgi:hypothetical protein